MKKKALLCAVLALLLTLASFGCAAEKVAARIGDREIKRYQVENLFKQYESEALKYFGYDITGESGLTAYQDYVLDMLLTNEAQTYQAELAGVTLTEEEQAKAKENADAEYDSFYQEHLDAALESGAQDVNAYANKLLTETLSKNRTSLSKFKKTLQTLAREQLVAEKYRTQLLAENAPTDADIQAFYDEEIELEKGSFDNVPSMYFSYLSYYQMGYSPIKPMYMPAGFFYVRQILVADEATANEVLAKVQSGTDFEELLSEYNTDPGMAVDEYIDGYVMGEGGNFVEPFLNAALALEKEGDISPVTQSELGFHIIRRGKDVPAGPLPIDEAFRTYAVSSLENEYWQGVLDTWLAEAERFPKVYRSIGRSWLVEATPAPDATATPVPHDHDGDGVADHTDEEHGADAPNP